MDSLELSVPLGAQDLMSSPPRFGLRSSIGRAPLCGRGGCGFDSHRRSMSYKKKKEKKKLINKLKYKLRLFKNVLFRKRKNNKEKMRLVQTRKVMTGLRLDASKTRNNNKRIDVWVDDYIDKCVREGQPVELLTQWCLSKDLELRYEKQGFEFSPLKAEEKLVRDQIPRIINLFNENAINISWCISFNKSLLETGRIPDEISDKYIEMVRQLIQENGLSDLGVFAVDWEDEVVGGKPGFSQNVLDNFSEIVPSKAFEIESERHLEWVRSVSPDTSDVEDEAIKQSKFKVACDAEEGSFLMGKDSVFPNGEFILIPLEAPERYVFFGILPEAKGFQKRISAVLPIYPWRM